MRQDETDRELLEFAAKAAGYVLVWGYDEIDCTDIPYIRSGQPDEGDVHWDPITDDGDAFRLMVKLRIHLDFGTPEGVPYVCAHRNGIEMIHDPVSAIESSYELDIIDWNVATRRAITRAAAEIGRNMK